MSIKRICRVCGELLEELVNYYPKGHNSYSGNICISCRKSQVHTRQSLKKDERTQYNKKYWAEHKTRLREESKKWRELNKEYVKQHNTQYYLNNKDKLVLEERERRKRKADVIALRRRNLKQEIIHHYSNGEMKCSLCPETRIDALSVDHINGGGHKHRTEKKFRGVGFYRWLKQQNYPTEFRILCMNCQFCERNKLYGWASHYGKS